jgi:hypothetical protein
MATNLPRKTSMGATRRKTLLMMLLTVVGSNALAEWVEVGRDEAMVAYAEPTTIRKAGLLA